MIRIAEQTEAHARNRDTVGITRVALNYANA